MQSRTPRSFPQETDPSIGLEAGNVLVGDLWIKSTTPKLQICIAISPVVWLTIITGPS